jgi:hypothetical protein
MSLVYRAFHRGMSGVLRGGTGPRGSARRDAEGGWIYHPPHPKLRPSPLFVASPSAPGPDLPPERWVGASKPPERAFRP